FTPTSPTYTYTLSLHDALPIFCGTESASSKTITFVQVYSYFMFNKVVIYIITFWTRIFIHPVSSVHFRLDFPKYIIDRLITIDYDKTVLFTIKIKEWFCHFNINVQPIFDGFQLVIIPLNQFRTICITMSFLCRWIVNDVVRSAACR